MSNFKRVKATPLGVNQVIIEVGLYGVYFQSYKSTVAYYNKRLKKLTLSQHWNYSRTTSKYLNLFIHRYTNITDTTNVKKLIKDKEITLLKETSIGG